MFGSDFTTLIFSNDEMNDIKIVESLGESGLLVKGISQISKNKAK